MRDALIAATAAGLLVLGACAPGEEAPEPEEAETAAAETEEAETPTGIEEAEEEAPKLAAANLQAVEGTDVSGTVSFTEQNGGVRIVARVSGVERAGLHGFHVHETGDCSASDFSSAGGHFAPEGNRHGCPDSPEHHAGDLGNIEILEDGTGFLDVTSEMLAVAPEDPHSVVGTAVILHAGEDDCESQPSGAAGDRIACGVIELQTGEPTTNVEEGIGEGVGGEEPSANSEPVS